MNRCPMTKPGKYGTVFTCALKSGHHGLHMEELLSPATGHVMFTHEWDVAL